MANFSGVWQVTVIMHKLKGATLFAQAFHAVRDAGSKWAMSKARVMCGPNATGITEANWATPRYRSARHAQHRDDGHQSDAGDLEARP